MRYGRCWTAYRHTTDQKVRSSNPFGRANCLASPESVSRQRRLEPSRVLRRSWVGSVMPGKVTDIVLEKSGDQPFRWVTPYC